MAHDLDYIHSVTKAYRFVYAHAAVIFMMAAVPLAVKIVNYVMIEAFGFGEHYVRQGLLLLPAFFAEGWVVAGIIRFAVQGEMIEEHLTGDPQLDIERFEGHFRAVTAAMIVFVLTKLVMALFVGLFMGEQARLSAAAPMDQPEYTMSSIAIGVFLICVLFYIFRFLWLYVPVALGYNMKAFLYRIRPFTSSMYMFAIYVMCFVPLSFIMMGLLNILANMSGGTENEIYAYGGIVIQSVIDMGLTVLVSIAMAFGVQAVFSREKG
jgi:magnesium-transporting ATPase (P-type)